MQNSIFRYGFGSLAGALVVLSGSFTYAATLNQNLRFPGASPLGVVADIGTGQAGSRAPDAVRIAQAGKTLPAVESAVPAEAAAQLVGRMLAPGPSNPDVPLPHPDLAEKSSDRTDAGSPLKGPTPYLRGETGGGVLGLRVPIPVNRRAASGTTTSSPAALPAEPSPAGDTRPR
jgi:hypothetical protein